MFWDCFSERSSFSIKGEEFEEGWAPDRAGREAVGFFLFVLGRPPRDRAPPPSLGGFIYPGARPVRIRRKTQAMLGSVASFARSAKNVPRACAELCGVVEYQNPAPSLVVAPVTQIPMIFHIKIGPVVDLFLARATTRMRVAHEFFIPC